MTLRRQRLMYVILALIGVSVAVALGLRAFKENLVFFFSPSQVASSEAPKDANFRIGGLVQKGSVKKQADGVTVSFVVTDNAESVPIVYKGFLPDLFREGQCIVAQGRLNANGVFVANEVLAKHDENYMPPEVAAAIKKAKEGKVSDPQYSATLMMN